MKGIVWALPLVSTSNGKVQEGGDPNRGVNVDWDAGS